MNEKDVTVLPAFARVRMAVYLWVGACLAGAGPSSAEDRFVRLDGFNLAVDGRPQESLPAQVSLGGMLSVETIWEKVEDLPEDGLLVYALTGPNGPSSFPPQRVSWRHAAIGAGIRQTSELRIPEVSSCGGRDLKLIVLPAYAGLDERLAALERLDEQRPIAALRVVPQWRRSHLPPSIRAKIAADALDLNVSMCLSAGASLTLELPSPARTLLLATRLVGARELPQGAPAVALRFPGSPLMERRLKAGIDTAQTNHADSTAHKRPGTALPGSFGGDEDKPLDGWVYWTRISLPEPVRRVELVHAGGEFLFVLEDVFLP